MMQQLAQEAEVAVEEGCVPRGADPDARHCRWGEQGLSPQRGMHDNHVAHVDERAVPHPGRCVVGVR